VLHVFGIDFRLLDCWKICRQKGHKWYPTSLNPLRFDNSSLSNPFYDAVIGPLGSTSYDMWELFPAVFWSLYKQSLYSDAWCLYIRYNAPLKPTSISIIGTYMIHEYPLQTAVPDAVTAQPLLPWVLDHWQGQQGLQEASSKCESVRSLYGLSYHRGC
jgi:hypothetical protein